MSWLAILAGGTLGSLLRAWLVAPEPGWIASTLGVNALACAGIGWLHARRHAMSAAALRFGAVGFCGGLSTFSAFAADVARLTQSGAWAQAATASGTEIAVGLAAAWAGERLGARRAPAGPTPAA